MKTVRVIDSHTAGEPTRVVVEGMPDLARGSMADRLKLFREKHDAFRSAVVNEPRGSDVLVGALWLPSDDPTCLGGVIFFNNVGYLGMCGHGTIGLMVTLADQGIIQPGKHRIETPVGVITAELHPDRQVSVVNVPSFRKAKGATIQVPGIGPVSGDVAWAGNWFYLVEKHPWKIRREEVELLTEVSWKIRQAVNEQGFPEVDHVELFGPGEAPDAHSRNFVLCPGKAYDRSPCGTGTSAKLACLAADGKLEEGKTWIQESILGTRFTGHFKWTHRERGEIIPTITGSAFVTADARLRLDEHDPLCWGIR